MKKERRETASADRGVLMNPEGFEESTWDRWSLRECAWIEFGTVVSHPFVQPGIRAMHRVHPHPVPLLDPRLLFELLHVILEGLGDHPSVRVPYETVEDRPHRRPVLRRELRDPLALPELLHMVEVEGLRDVLRDVVDRGGVSLDAYVVLRERVDVDEPDLPDRTDGVPVIEVLQPAEDAARVRVRWVRTERVALPMELDLQGLVQMQQDVDRRIAGDRRLLDDHLGVASFEGLLQTGEEPGDALALGRYEEVGLVAGHDLVVDGQRHEEQMRV